jgi:small subunit ribosomal protein S5
MAERISDETQELESTTVGIYRTAAVVKGGRRFSFSALVVVGDRRGKVGIGYGKAPGVPSAIEKAQKNARKQMYQIALQEGTIPHAVNARFGASKVRMVPAAPGTGVIAGATLRAILEMAGVRDCLTKAFGSTNPKNLVKAALEGLRSLRRKATIATIRGVELEDTDVERALEAGRRYAPAAAASSERVKGPVNKVGQKGGAKGGKGRRRREEETAPAAAGGADAAAAPAAPQA